MIYIFGAGIWWSNGPFVVPRCKGYEHGSRKDIAIRLNMHVAFHPTVFRLMLHC